MQRARVNLAAIVERARYCRQKEEGVKTGCEARRYLYFATAIVFHFVAVDHALREGHGDTYQRTGRFILAGACTLGWGLGLVIALPRHMFSLLTAFISGAIIINSAIMELPGERDGRFLPFMTGGIVYGLILVPLG